MSHVTLLEFARVNDAVAATSRKLQKQAVLSELFRNLEEDVDLRLAVRFARGRPFPATDERTLGVGGATVSDVALSILHVDLRTYHDAIIRHGEIGEALATLWTYRADRGVAAEAEARPVTLRDLSIAFEDLASTGNQERKRDLLRDLSARCHDPREVAYLSKIIFGDMRTGVQEGVLQAAIAQAFDKPLKQIQRAQLLVGDLEEVAVLARHNELEAARFRLFHPIQFMLATPQETAEEAAETMAGKTFFAEDKLDGIRAQVHKQGDRVVIYTRTMDAAHDSFPDVVEAVRQLPGEFLLDGEIVPFQHGCVLPFVHIQKRLGRKVLTPRMLRENPCAFVAFDILYRDGRLLMDEPLRVRRKHLADVGVRPLSPLPLADHRTNEGAYPVVATPASPSMRSIESIGGFAAGAARATQASQLQNDGVRAVYCTSPVEVTTASDITAAFESARACRNEGLVLKDPDSIYAPGRRGKMWLKLKTHLPTLDCVVTAAEYGHGKRKNVLSDYTFAVWDREPAEEGATLVNVGKAYSGVTDQEIAQLTELFLSISRGRWGWVHPVAPRIVLEIAFDQIQRSTRHASGYALRFPRIKRIRWDKKPEEADRLARVVELYNDPANFAKTQAPAEPVTEPEPTLFDGT